MRIFPLCIFIALFLQLNVSAAPKPLAEHHFSNTQSNYSPQKNAGGDLDFLKKYAGKYPHDVKLLSNPALAKRLKKLLGARYAFVKKTWAVETPMQMKDNVFSASGCQQHNCADTNFIIAVDFSKNVLYAGIREETKVKLYAEDGSTNKDVNDWAQNWDNRK